MKGVKKQTRRYNMVLYQLTDRITWKNYPFIGSEKVSIERQILNWIMNYAERDKTFKAEDWFYRPSVLLAEFYDTTPNDKQIIEIYTNQKDIYEIKNLIEEFNKKYER
jgi:hypothetical protein